jgi:hypothetical protein
VPAAAAEVQGGGGAQPPPRSPSPLTPPQQEGVPPTVGTADPDEAQLLSLGDIEEVELLLAICDHLDSPRDLGRLACVSRAFGMPVDVTIAEGRAPCNGQRLPLVDMTYMDLKRKAIDMGVMKHEIPPGKDDLIEMLLLSVVEESARRWVLVRQPKGRVVPRDSRSWLRRMYDIQGSPSRFVHSVKQTVALSDNGAVATIISRTTPTSFCTTIGGVLEGDVNYAVFTLERGSHMFVGVVAEQCECVYTGQAHTKEGNCFICTVSGKCWPGNSDWLGQGPVTEGDRVGLLLNTTTGSLSVFMNRVFRGVMMGAGLLGRYRWAVSMRGVGDRVRIEPGPVPRNAVGLGLTLPSRVAIEGNGFTLPAAVLLYGSMQQAFS